MTVKNLAMGLAITMALAACGSDGSSDQDFRTGCTVDGQCAIGRCLTGGNFPGGLCTRACSSSAGCPSGWSCISNSSGVCMRNCATNVDCASL